VAALSLWLQSLKVLWKQPSTGLKIALKVIMAAAVPAAPVVLSMLELLVGNMAALKATCSDLLQQSQAFERQVGPAGRQAGRQAGKAACWSCTSHTHSLHCTMAFEHQCVFDRSFDALCLPFLSTPPTGASPAPRLCRLHKTRTL
jgi:hypothetical protein